MIERDDLAWTDDLLARLSPVAPLTPGQIARIRSNITARPRASGRRVAVIGALAILLTASIAFGVVRLVRPAPSLPLNVAPPLRIAPPLPIAPPPGPVRIAQLPAPAPAPEPAPPPIVRPRHASHGAAPSVEPPMSPPQAPADRTSELGAESRMMAAALRDLRTAHDPAAALEALDRYAVQFPHGMLGGEAREARIEALLATGDKRTALALLDAMTVGSELAVLRGELRLEAHRPADAVTDFTAALDGARDRIEQRALFGRAAARTQLGDRAAACADLELYLERFPNGSSVAAAHTALAECREQR